MTGASPAVDRTGLHDDAVLAHAARVVRSRLIVVCAAMLGLAAAGCDGGSNGPAATDEGASDACLQALAARAPLAPKDKLHQHAIAKLQVSATASGWTVAGRTAARPGFAEREFACHVARTDGGAIHVRVTRDSKS
jgi:hypothetical protein